MLGQALRRATRSHASAASTPRAEARSLPRVEVSRCDAATQGRLRRLAASSGAFVVTGFTSADGAPDTTDATAAEGDPTLGGGAAGPPARPVTVVSLGSVPADGEVVAQLRREHRSDPQRRIVVIGRSTTWFDAAFGAGVDAWVDASAEDATVVAAIIGRAAA